MAGRPAQFEDENALQNKVDEYFTFIQGEQKHVDDSEGEYDEWVRYPEAATITGLALFLGFESRQSIYDYEKKDDAFSYTIKRARLRIENAYEKALLSKNPIGSIFALKNFGWVDKVETGFTDKEGNDRSFEITLNIK